MKKLFLSVLMLFVFSCSSGGGGSSGSCDDCSEDSLLGGWQLRSETIEYSSNCMLLDEEYDYHDEVWIVFDEDDTFSYFVGNPDYSDSSDECTGSYDLEDNCEIEIEFDGWDCEGAPLLNAMLFLTSGGPLDVCVDMDHETATVFGTFDLYELGAQFSDEIPEGCELTWTGEFRED